MNSTDSNNSSLIGGIIGGILALLLIVAVSVAIFFIVKRRKRGNVSEYSFELAPNDSTEKDDRYSSFGSPGKEGRNLNLSPSSRRDIPLK